jgi:tRNA threonylcarbamoyladenosine biosynthesis protein TsaE
MTFVWSSVIFIIQIYKSCTTLSINIFATTIQNHLQKEFTIQNIRAIAKELWNEYHMYKVWAFDAQMGMGKTTFIHALCDVLGVTDAVGSPTFSIINQYQLGDGRTLYHLDLYRINDAEEALHAGIEDVLYSGDYCMVEWPEKIPGLMPENALKISIDALSEVKRRITVTIPE